MSERAQLIVDVIDVAVRLQSAGYAASAHTLMTAATALREPDDEALQKEIECQLREWADRSHLSTWTQPPEAQRFRDLVDVVMVIVKGTRR